MFHAENMNKKIALLISVVALLIIISSIIAFSAGINVMKSNDTTTYIIREYDGNIAVFKEGLEKPFMFFDVPVSTLPDLDQKQLSEGIKCDGLDDLNKRIEDYIS